LLAEPLVAAPADVSGPEPVDATLPAETIEEAAAQMPGAEEGRMVGHVRWQVCTAYMKAVGTGLVFFVLLSLALMQVHTLVSHKLGFYICPSHYSCCFPCLRTYFCVGISIRQHCFSATSPD